MLATLSIWVLCSAVVFVGLLFGRTSQLHRRLRIADLDWKSALVMSLIVGAVPAFVFDQVNHRPVDVPGSIMPVPLLPPAR
ncbi:MAG: hypothetical protein FJX64_04170 [Alphaproteobacteria bacterium]|nr:hypothetical protein [Alphaproteobacteria bacterium]